MGSGSGMGMGVQLTGIGMGTGMQFAHPSLSCQILEGLDPAHSKCLLSSECEQASTGPCRLGDSSKMQVSETYERA